MAKPSYKAPTYDQLIMATGFGYVQVRGILHSLRRHFNVHTTDELVEKA